MKFMALEKGFDLKEYLGKRKESKDIDIISETKGYLWLGVRRYLLDTGDIREHCGI